MKHALLALTLLASGVMATGAAAQSDALADQIRVVARDGHEVSLTEVVAAASQADVVFLGEIHDDSLGHVVKMQLLRALHEAVSDQRPLVLGLEMFETDVQHVLDEYASGVIRERDFLSDSRPWGNYATDYRPLVEFAVANGIPVVGTNAPKRYVSRVSREGGVDALGAIAPEARATMPAEIVPASEPLAAKFRGLMGDMGSHGAAPGMPTVDGMLAAQNLRDATMAWALHRTMEDVRRMETFFNQRSVEAGRVIRPLAVHVNGSFHSEGGLGIPEHLARLAPEARVVVVTMRPASGGPADPGADDFLILTGAQ
jgi:uncharacterized iron-regulated protein